MFQELDRSELFSVLYVSLVRLSVLNVSSPVSSVIGIEKKLNVLKDRELGKVKEYRTLFKSRTGWIGVQYYMFL